MNNFNEADSKAREQALNPAQSFIVQAPAGSGKTELLTQRFLVLLNYVNTPEEILAITFTKKSAHEMRARIINTLKNAAASTTEPELAHAKKTWHLAKKVLQRDEQFQWNLLSNPNRLRIQTIDSFNASLTKRLPILAQFGASPEIADQPTLLYQEAVREFLSHLEENVAWSDAIAQLLLHIDNDLNKVETLLINMLAKRDQWLPHIALNANDPELREKLEGYLSNVIQDTLTRLAHAFPQAEAEELLTLIRFAAANLAAEKSTSRIVECHNLTSLPTDDISDLNAWLGIAEFLLVKEHAWRKTFNVNQGFPAPGKAEHLKEIKNRAIALVNQFHEREDLRSLFEQLRLLPTEQYSESQWQVLQALHLALQVVAGQLRVIFQKYGKIDYIENAQGALLALGDNDAPTDIALALDYRIQHILVDEFQDTANIQYRLLEKLTAGWEPHDGRTLFVVGDPMQSIYRFREAEVGLFIRARKQGIGHIKLIPLTLSVNFRSIPGIVNWVNTHFKSVLPTVEDISTGAVSYSQSMANQSGNEIVNTTESAVELHPFLSDDAFTDQAQKVVSLIQKAKQTNPAGKIAILVRTRTHLKAIIPALKSANLAFRAINIDPLSMRPTIQDLMALTRALLHPADRIAWLSVLRAPWCGLTLEDLFTLAGKDKNTHLYKQLQSQEIVTSLSADGQKRLARVFPILKAKVQERRRHSLRLWIESTWILLGGPACVDQPSELEDAAAYFSLLDKLDNGGDLTNINTLAETTKQLFAAPDHHADDLLQIMTIHNAKGLEFDTVILPHLERKPSYDDKQLLLWVERPREDEDSDLIIAPVNAIGEKEDPIYEYIKDQIKAKSQFENGRLLYVAATRAKQKLHILFSLETLKNNDAAFKAPSHSLLEQLMPAIAAALPSLVTSDKEKNNVNTVVNNVSEFYLKRLPSAWVNPIKEFHASNVTAFHQKISGFQLPDLQPKIMGTLLHSMLQQLARHGISWWTEKTLQQQDAYIKNQLIQAGLVNNDLAYAINTIKKGIKNSLDDQRGLWILTHYPESHAELPVTARIDNEVKQFIIDRTFVDETGVRWIIDYKTTIFTPQDLDEFLNQKQKKHEEQLWHYYLAMREIDSRPIRVGLYFPLIPAWKEWSF